MMVASLALHLGLGAGFALSYYHAHPFSAGDSAPDTTTSMIMLGSVQTPNLSPMHPFAPLASSALTNKPSSPVAPPTPPPAPIAKVSPPAAPTAYLALRANPNAHLSDIPPEEILSPHPVPLLDSEKGVVFVLDVSGSMYEPYAGATRLAFAREALARRILALPDGAPFAVILYAERSSRSGPLVAASALTRDAAVRFIMQDADCGGGTNLPDGLAWAAQLHAGSIIVISDGDLNTSLDNLLTQTDPLLGPKSTGPALTVVGIAPRVETKDEMILQALASHRGGVYRAEPLADASTLMANRVNPVSP